MVKIESFNSGSFHSLGKEVKEWFEENPDIKVITAVPFQDPRGAGLTFCLSIFYKENKKGG